VVCLAPRAPEDIVRTRRLVGSVCRPLNFTVRPQLLVHAQLIAKRINAAPALTSGSLRFWGEGFGKHKLVQCSAIGDTLLVEFDDGGTLTVVDPDGLKLSATTLLIRSATSVRWQFYHGRSRAPENLYFYEYRRSGTTIAASTNVNWYNPHLSPSVAENAVEILGAAV